MIVAVTAGLYVVYDDWFFRYVGRRWSERGYNSFSSVLNALTSAALCGTLVVSAHPLYEEYFSVMFGILAVALMPPVISDIFYLNRVARRAKYYKVDPTLTLKVRTYLIVGIFIAIASTLLWIIPESICKRVADSSAFLFWSHGVWHVGMSYALITVSQCIVYIHLVETKPRSRDEIKKSVVRTKFNCPWGNRCCCGCLASSFFCFFLIVQPHFIEMNDQTVMLNQGKYLSSKHWKVVSSLDTVSKVTNLVKSGRKVEKDKDPKNSEEEKSVQIEEPSDDV